MDPKRKAGAGWDESGVEIDIHTAKCKIGN